MINKNTFNMFVFILSGIGPGWAPAIINSTFEYTFIQKQHQLLHNNVSFWIGGTTIAEGKIELSDYMKHSPCPGRVLQTQIYIL